MAQVAAAEQLRVEHIARSEKELKEVLLRIPKLDKAVIPHAITALMEAANDYKASKLLVDEKGRRSRPGVADARAAMVKLNKSLVTALDQLDQLPINARTVLISAYDAPLGKFRADLTSIRAVTDTALTNLRALPDKSPDHHRDVLAYRVAIVCRDILKLKVSSTPHTSILLKPNGSGAIYSKVLHATLGIAGLVHVDIAPVIAAGLGLLKAQELPGR